MRQLVTVTRIRRGLLLLRRCVMTNLGAYTRVRVARIERIGNAGMPALQI